jgi:polar amino acid transport system substrate-binding protein
MPDFPLNKDGKPLVVGVSVEDLPYVALMNGKFVGFDIEMVQTFASRRNYKLELVSIEFPALVAALSSGKVDMITDGIAISEERGKQINFSDEYAVFRTSVISLKSNLLKYKDEKQLVVTKSFLTKLSESLHNNIIREKRYLMILRGLLLTILISIFAATTGTLLGGLVCFMRMSRNKIMNKIASYYISLVRGTPVLVLLMIIYYVVFASVNISAVLVAIIAFGINFAAYVSEMFRTGIESIDKGQKEAGIASGFTKIKTFRYIIMPQALRQVLPVYKGEFVSLVKMTSIVGYIAVEDLTKASDIIRSRTFDAFFPLIMAAVIYILISWLLTLILDYVEINVDPKKRRMSQRKEELK